MADGLKVLIWIVAILLNGAEALHAQAPSPLDSAVLAISLIGFGYSLAVWAEELGDD